MNGPWFVATWRRSLIALMSALLLAGAFAQDALVTLELGSDRRGLPAITATVTDAAGTPLSRREVNFYFIPDFFPNAGNRLNGNWPVFLGSRTTNVVGQAQLPYDPPYTGLVEFEATVAASEGLGAGSGTMVADIVREDDPAPEPHEIPLVGIRRPLEQVILGIVIGVWLILLILTGSTMWMIHRRGKGVIGGGTPRAAG
jgi:hypothetical protein